MMLPVHLRSGKVFLACRLFVPKRPNGLGVAYSHGWGGAHVFDDLHARLADWGFTVASIEQRGYGASSGKPQISAWPDDLGAAATWLQARGLKVWAMGLSTGGTMALVTAAQRPDLLGAVAISPFATLKKIQEDYPPCREILRERFGRFAAADFAAADARHWAPRIAPRRAVVIHCADDEIVPFAHAKAIRAGAPRTVELWRIPGGDHRLETIKRAPLFDRIRSVLARGGKR
jgi:pimeloyl-ACP methyl ester carboxylesterase